MRFRNSLHSSLAQAAPGALVVTWSPWLWWWYECTDQCAYFLIITHTSYKPHYTGHLHICTRGHVARGQDACSEWSRRTLIESLMDESEYREDWDRYELVPQIDPSVPQPVFTITEKAPTRAFSWLKAPTSAFTFKTLLRHYAEQVLTHRK